MKKLILAAMMAALSVLAFAQDKPLRFGFMTDLHFSVGSVNTKYLEACIADVNANEKLDFVIFGGDLTEFGADEEIKAVKAILDKLNVKYYIVAGNHDSTWSESGCNTFIKVFGYERFEFEAGGWRFIGCNCGPDMRMTPALLPKECMLWLDSMEKDKKTIFVNHYPQDSSVLNYFDVTKQLKKIGTQFEIGGHWHSNRALNYDGIPAVLCRSTINSGNGAGYDIFTLTDNHVTVQEKRVYSNSSVLLEPWYEADLKPLEDKTHYDENGLPDSYPWMRYDVNTKYPSVKEVWKVKDNGNIVSGFAIEKDKAYYCTSPGGFRCISVKNGKRLWEKQLPGKVFSTAAVSEGRVIVGCSDNKIYCFDASNGKELWTVEAGKSVLGSAAIRNGIAYIGASDGVFRAIDIKTGDIVWKYEDVKGFVVTTPYVDDEQVVFGTWAYRLYSLDPKTGKLQWCWTHSRHVRGYSPAASVPVKANGRIFVAIPDRKVWAIDAKTGKDLFWVNGGREAVGMSPDGKTVYAKTMFGQSFAFPSDAPLSDVSDKGELNPSKLIWKVPNQMGYEISPTALKPVSDVVLFPADKGNIIALKASDGSFAWAHKISTALVNPVQVWTKGGKNYILASSMDGVVTLLQF